MEAVEVEVGLAYGDNEDVDRERERNVANVGVEVGR